MCRSKYKSKSLTGFSICSSILLRDGINIRSINVNLTYDKLNEISFVMAIVLMLILATYFRSSKTKINAEKLKKE